MDNNTMRGDERNERNKNPGTTQGQQQNPGQERNRDEKNRMNQPGTSDTGSMNQ